MAQEAESERNAPGIARVGKRKWGYDTDQVDEFLERAHSLYESESVQLSQEDIQDVSFDLRKGGYAIAQVDAALARLERAVFDQHTNWEITEHGRVAWKAQTEELYRAIAKRAERAERERFRDGTAKQPSYDRRQVDRLVDKVVDKAAAGLGIEGSDANDDSLVDFHANTVANVIFTQRKGKKGYDERQVDYFLNACVRLLSRLESFARVADYVTNADKEPEETAPAPVRPAAAVSPLFTPAAQSTTDQPVSFAPSGYEAATGSFDALHKAEEAIFNNPQSEANVLSPAQESQGANTFATQTFAPSTPTSATAAPAESESAAASGGSSSLAALASASRSTTPTEGGAPTSAMDLPSFDEAADESSQTHVESSQDGTADSVAEERKPVFPPVHEEPSFAQTLPEVPALPTETSLSFDIPDLSFPTFTPQTLASPAERAEDSETKDAQ